MSKTYTLPSISMAVGAVGSWTDADWHGYTKRADQSVMQVGYANNGICATNILFNPTTLALLRTKTIESIKLVLTVTWGTIQASGSTAYPIGYKLNGEDGITANTGNNAWTRSNADSTAASTTVAVGYITSQKSSQISVGNTPVTLTYDLTGTKVPKYGYSLGNAFLLTSHLNLAASATLIVVTNEVDYSFTLSYNANGGTGAPSAQTGTGTVVGTPSHTFTISNTMPTRDGFFFDGWKVSGGTTLYQPGDQITVTANTTLYAQWSPASSVISSVTDSVPITGDALTGKLTVNITRYNASYTHDVKITLGSRTTTLTGQGTTAEFVIPVSWLDQIPEATSRVATVEVTTKSGSTVIGVVSSATFTATVPANVLPTATLTSTDVNTNSTIDGWDVLVQGYSKIKLDVVAAAGAGSSIKSITFSGDNVSLSGLDTTVTSDILTITGERTWQVVVTDKRNRSTTVTLTRTVYPYAMPAIGDLQAIRSNSSGTESPNDGTYASAKSTFSFSDCGGNNSLVSKKIYYKIQTQSQWTEGVADAISGAWNTFGGGNILLVYVYDIKVEITDAVGNTATAFAEVNSVVGFAVGLKNDRARFGGPVQKPGLQVDWDTEFLGDVEVQGDLIGGGVAKSVNGQVPDSAGAVVLSASDVGALDTANGGSIDGDVTFNGAIAVANGDLSNIGTVHTPTPGAVTLASGSWTTVCSQEVDEGLYIVFYKVRFPSNANGLRKSNLSTSADSSTSLGAIYDDCQTAVSGDWTFCSAVGLYRATSTSTIYVNAYQTSGSSMSNVYGRLQAIRIIG